VTVGLSNLSSSVVQPNEVELRRTIVIQRTHYVLAVRDLEKSAAYYRDVMGFEVREIGDPGWRMFVRDGCRIMAGECRDTLPARELGDHSYFAYFIVDDVDACHAAVVAKGADLVKPLRTEPWGLREFGLRTIDGHRIMIGQEMGT
jgi:predicted enzyme related to lactoylglutathione lyase